MAFLIGTAYPAMPQPAPASPSAAFGYAGERCLSLADGRRLLQSASAVSLGAAVAAARASSPGEIVDYKVCQAQTGFSYVLTVLGRDGRITRARVDALSGKLLSAR